jgi:hypothetical protein
LPQERQGVNPLSDHEISTLVWEVASAAAGKGLGWAQEGVVLRLIGERLAKGKGQPDLRVQQAILNAWHDLFTDKKLAWGYNLDNPNSPFFHLR